MSIDSIAYGGLGAGKSFLLFAVVLLFMLWSRDRKKNFPSGPSGIPIVGYLPFLGSSPPDTLIALSKKYGKIFALRLGRKSHVVLTKYEDIYEAFVKRSSSFSGREVSQLMLDNGAQYGIIYRPYSDTYKCIRKLGITALKGFGVGKRSMEDKVNEELGWLVGAVRTKDGQPFDIHEHLNNSVANVIMSVVCGKRCDLEDKQFQKILELLSERFNGQSTAKRLFLIDMFPVLKHLPYFKTSHSDLVKQTDACSQMFLTSIRHHETTFDKSDLRDVLDAYLYESQFGKHKDHLEKSFLLVLLRDLFNAGTETTTTTLRWCLLYLAKNIDTQEELRTEINSVLDSNELVLSELRKHTPLTCSFIHEMQRRRPIVPLVTHATTDNVEFQGYRIPANTPVIANIWQSHHDDATFKDAWKFDPRRFINAQGHFEKHDRVIPYSVGPRYCLGMHLAELEVYVFLVGLIRSFRFTEDRNDPLPGFEEKVAGLVHSPLPFKLQFLSTKSRS